MLYDIGFGYHPERHSIASHSNIGLSDSSSRDS